MLPVETNIDVSDADVKFVILEPPTNGRLKKDDTDEHRFSLADVKNRLVTYEHVAGNEKLQDDFKFVVKVTVTVSSIVIFG